MIDWIARAKTAIPQTVGNPTAKTDETPISSPSSVGAGPVREKHASRFLSREQANECHSPSWSDAEIERFTARLLFFVSRGFPTGRAEGFAEWCVLADRRQDGLRLCAECQHLERGARCANWSEAGYQRPEAVLIDVPQRCPGFALAPAPAPVASDQGLSRERPQVGPDVASRPERGAPEPFPAAEPQQQTPMAVRRGGADGLLLNPPTLKE